MTAARGLMIDLLGPDVPQDATQLDTYFKADVSSLTGKEADTINFYARNLKGTIFRCEQSLQLSRAESLRIFPPLVRANIFSRHRSTDIAVVKNALETAM